jgi:hypothetical protein
VVAVVTVVAAVAIPETPVEAAEVRMLAVTVEGKEVMAAIPVGAAMVARQIEQEKQQNPPHESKLHEMPQKPPTPEWLPKQGWLLKLKPHESKQLETPEMLRWQRNKPHENKQRGNKLLETRKRGRMPRPK